MSSSILTKLDIAMSQNSSPDKKDQQVGFKVDSNLLKRLQIIADREERKQNEMARMLFEWAVEKCEEFENYTFREVKRLRLVPPSGEDRGVPSIEKKHSGSLKNSGKT